MIWRRFCLKEKSVEFLRVLKVKNIAWVKIFVSNICFWQTQQHRFSNSQNAYQTIAKWGILESCDEFQRLMLLVGVSQRALCGPRPPTCSSPVAIAIAITIAANESWWMRVRQSERQRHLLNCQLNAHEFYDSESAVGRFFFTFFVFSAFYLSCLFSLSVYRVCVCVLCKFQNATKPLSTNHFMGQRGGDLMGQQRWSRGTSVSVSANWERNLIKLLLSFIGLEISQLKHSSLAHLLNGPINHYGIKANKPKYLIKP